MSSVIPMTGFQSVAITRVQNVSGTAVALSGVTELELRQNNLDTLWLTCETSSIRYRWDGTSPTTTAGHVLPVNTPLQLSARNRILNFVFIGAAGASAVVTFTLDHRSTAGGVE